jgi:hypothetical protein
LKPILTPMHKLMKFKILFIFLIITTSCTYGQSKIITGNKHIIFVEMPKNWVQIQHESLPLLMKPTDSIASDKVFMYVYGIDYNASPNLDKWIKGDIDAFKGRNPDTKVDSIQLSFPNLDTAGYQTGRYKIITYTYPDQHKEAMLAVECKNTIATVLLSAKVGAEFDKYFPAFKETVKSLQILAAKVTYK